MFQNTQIFSRKVFIGGLPLGITEMELKQIFSFYGALIVEWSSRPSELVHKKTDDLKENSPGTGYAFLVYMEEVSVRRLISQCHREGSNFYINIPPNKTRPSKIVQVRPWRLADAQYIPDPTVFQNLRNTIFIGALPRTTTAQQLASALESKFGPVCYVGIDADPHLKYPKGAVRATFKTYKHFISAIAGRFLDVRNTDGWKTVEIKPYIVKDQMCDECFGTRCMNRPAPYFCTDLGCMQYYCETCWDLLHYGNNSHRQNHKPFMKNQ